MSNHTPPRRIRVIEPVADTEGRIWPIGTEAELIGPGPDKWGGHDYETTTGEILWALVPAQYEAAE